MRALLCGLILAFSLPALAQAEDGYDLWLRYKPMEQAALTQYRPLARELVTGASSPTLNAARDELVRGLDGLLAETVPVTDAVHDGAIVIGTPASSSIVAKLNLPLKSAGAEGYLIRSATIGGHPVTVIAANSDVGVLYGSFAYLRLLQTRQPVNHLAIASAPRIKLRVLDHWDNLDGTIERGYAGHSIWDWQVLPDYVSPRMTDYARADASVGINGVSLNNVAADPVILTPDYLKKVAALANTFRPYGIRVYLAAKFSAPIELGGLKTADPADPAVRAWWKAKVDDIYRLIPDFGGFVVKANSEGQPGPGDYHRTQAEGANMIADALAPHHGVVMWRAFIYDTTNHDDRAKQAYTELHPLDGKFRDNVILQVKNGPIDFQPREPAHPLFGAMPHTVLGLEVQLSKEYLGFSTHLVYLPALYKEVLDIDTLAEGKGSTVARIVDGTLDHHKLSAMVGDSNVGDDRDWTGGQFDQADWYGFGRLAWDDTLTPQAIAHEWLGMTFTNDPAFVKPVTAMMMESREAVVDYMTPLGLHHLMATGHHYGPGPWVHNLARAEWNPVYYHHADAVGLGFDRTPTGSNATGQYAPAMAKILNNIHTIPEKYLLWFHHVPWDYKLKSGHTLWDALVIHYTRGVETVHHMRADWAKMKPFVDARRHAQIAAYLEIQEKEAQWWRDACIAYFQTFAKRPLPAGTAPPPHSLSYYESIYRPYAPGNPGLTAAPFHDTPDMAQIRAMVAQEKKAQ
jgi:alpha-glucuronidase